MKKLIPLLLVLLGYALYSWTGVEPPAAGTSPPAAESPRHDGRPARDAIARDPVLRPGQQARGSGIVTRVLADDNDGSRHQRFILELPSRRTLLVAHNIDVAPRIPGLKRGDVVEFYGVFENNERGGVIHWTHHDPRGQHTDGWLEHKGRRYR